MKLQDAIFRIRIMSFEIERLGKKVPKEYPEECKKAYRDSFASYQEAIETVLEELENKIPRKKKYKLFIRKYDIFKNDYTVIEQIVETNDIYHEIGYMYCHSIEEIKRIDYQLLEE